MSLIARRKFLTGLIAAPLVVSYQNIMPVKLFVPDVPDIGILGYKGKSVHEVGLFYCPYVPYIK
jgi:hypothetical protein